MQIGGYWVTGELGAGGMGVVFRAQDSSGNPVAIKMIGSRAAINATMYAGHAIHKGSALDLRSRMMLVREASVATEWDHPNIVRVFHYGQHEGLLYIVMEYLPGQSLDKIISIQRAIPLRTKIGLVRQVCDALEYAHGNGVMHRDIKPGNTMVMQGAKLKVLDFGLAAGLRAPVSGEVAVVGTPHYMAPEIFLGANHLSASIDIWATGVTFYQLLTGNLPFAAPSISEVLNKIAQARFPRLDSDLPYHRELEGILDRAMAKDPVNRYASAREFAIDLKRLEVQVNELSRATGPMTARADHTQTTWVAEETQAGGSESVVMSRIDLSAASPKHSAGTPREMVSIVSGGVAVRRVRPMARFVRHNARVFRWAVITTFCWGCVGFVSAFVSPFHFSNPWAWWTASFLFGIVFPILLLISVLFGMLLFWEKLVETPRCRNCRCWMQHQSRVSRFATARSSWEFASSDCLAALKENLWEDAAKLLSMHGEFVGAEVENGSGHALTSYPMIRYQLDFYSCSQCGDECAILTTEDRAGQAWSAREAFEGAYRCKAREAAQVRVSQHGLAGALKRAVSLSVEPVKPANTILLVVTVLLLALYFGPLTPQLVRVSGYKASIMIKADPAGRAILVDGVETVTPATFSWFYGTTHSIAGDDWFKSGGKVYSFQNMVLGANETKVELRFRDSPWRFSLRPREGGWEGRAQIISKKDRWGRPTGEPVVSRYTAEYAEAGTAARSHSGVFEPKPSVDHGVPHRK